jgi:hypothetical protein
VNSTDVMSSDSEFSASSTPLSSVASRESLCDPDTSIATTGSVDCDGQDEEARRESIDIPSCSSQSENDGEKQHPKGKRKRTAAKDKAILEEAYRNNPKPDKWARLEIVDRVSLNEKEVQIWFQNRRQNDRRKSRPLSPQEIDALRSGSMQILSTDPFYASYNGTPPAPMATASAAGPVPYLAPFSSNVNQQHHGLTAGVRGVGQDSITSPRDINVGFREMHGDEGARRPSHPSSAGHAPIWNGNPFPTLNSPTLHAPSFASRRSPSVNNPRYLYGRSISPTTAAAPILAPSLINVHVQARSQARISLSFDGKAEIVPERELSPPRLPHPARSLSAAALPGLPLAPPQARSTHSALQRSHSALSLPNITLPPISTLTDSLPSSATASAAPSPAFVPPRLGHGRSRDAHAWELCADADACDELTAQAENEASGSALAAISLIRSTVGVHQATQAKRNTALSGKHAWSSSAHPTLDTTVDQRPQLDRSSSSASRSHAITSLLSPDEGPQKWKDDSSNSKMDVSMLLAPDCGDWNKENRSPDEETFSFQPVQPQPCRPRRLPRMLHGDDDSLMSSLIRRDSLPVPQQCGLLGKRRPSDDSRPDIYEDGSDMHNDGRRVRRRSDDDIDEFMQGDISPSKKSDLDCITGLLRLRDGIWT